MTNYDATGITNEMLSDAPYELDVFNELSTFISDNLSGFKDNYIIAHNGLTFDFIFLKSCFAIIQKILPFKYFDTLLFSRYLHPGLNSHRSSTLAHKNIYNVTMI